MLDKIAEGTKGTAKEGISKWEQCRLDHDRNGERLASQPRVRQWTNDATRAAWLAKRNIGLLVISQASTEACLARGSAWKASLWGHERSVCSCQSQATYSRLYSARRMLHHDWAMIRFQRRTSVIPCHIGRYDFIALAMRYFFFFMNRGLHSNRTLLDSRRVRRCTDKFYFAAANEIWRSVSSQPRELMYLQNSAKYFQWRSWMYAFGSNELTNSSWWHNDFACWIIKIYLNNKMERSSRAWLVFIGSGRLVNRGTTETEGPRCALLLVSFALHSSGWKVFVGYRNCHSCYKCVLYFCWCCMT